MPWSGAQEPLGRLLMRAMKLHRDQVHETLDGLGLYRGQAFILRVLWEEEGLQQTELAARTWVQPATMTTALQRMEQAGLIDRRPDLEDLRVSRVYLTEEGRALQGPVQEALQAMERRTFAGLDEDARRRLRSYLDQIVDNLSQAKS